MTWLWIVLATATLVVSIVVLVRRGRTNSGAGRAHDAGRHDPGARMQADVYGQARAHEGNIINGGGFPS